MFINKKLILLLLSFSLKAHIVPAEEEGTPVIDIKKAIQKINFIGFPKVLENIIEDYLKDSYILKKEFGKNINDFILLNDATIVLYDYYDHKIKILDLQTNIETDLITTPENGWIRLAKISDTLFAVSINNAIKVFDFVSGDSFEFENLKPIRALLAFVEDKLLSGSDEGIKLWDLKERQRIKWVGHQVNSLAILKDGRVAAGLLDGRVQIWNLDNNDNFYVKPKVNEISALIEIDDNILAVENWNKIEIYNLETKEKESTLSGHDFHVLDFLLLPDSKLISTSWNRVKIWDLKQKKLIQTIKTYPTYHDGHWGHYNHVSVKLFPNNELAVLTQGKIMIFGKQGT